MLEVCEGWGTALSDELVAVRKVDGHCYAFDTPFGRESIQTNTTVL